MTVRYQLPEKLNTAGVPSLIADLRARQGGDLVLDASLVEHIGGLALQTLIVAAKDWRDSGLRLDVENVPDSVLAQMRLLGASPDLLATGGIR